MENIEEYQQFFQIICLRAQRWFYQNIIRSSIKKFPMTAPSRASLWYPQRITMDNTGQQSAVLNAPLMPFLFTQSKLWGPWVRIQGGMFDLCDCSRFQQRCLLQIHFQLPIFFLRFSASDSEHGCKIYWSKLFFCELLDSCCSEQYFSLCIDLWRWTATLLLGISQSPSQGSETG